jgi:hypothetical protein
VPKAGEDCLGHRRAGFGPANHDNFRLSGRWGCRGTARHPQVLQRDGRGAHRWRIGFDEDVYRTPAPLGIRPSGLFPEGILRRRQGLSELRNDEIPELCQGLGIGPDKVNVDGAHPYFFLGPGGDLAVGLHRFVVVWSELWDRCTPEG